jgi:hypothetical protein
VHIQIADNAIDVDHYSVFLKSRNQVMISNNEFFRQVTDTAGACDVYLDTCSNIIIDGNISMRDGGGSNPATAYDLNACAAFLITNNLVRNRDIGMDIDSASTRPTIVNNDLDMSPNITCDMSSNIVSDKNFAAH